MSVKTQGVFRYLKQGITVVYPSVDAERVTAFAVKGLGQSEKCSFFKILLIGLIKKIKAYGCKCPVT